MKSCFYAPEPARLARAGAAGIHVLGARQTDHVTAITTPNATGIGGAPTKAIALMPATTPATTANVMCLRLVRAISLCDALISRPSLCATSC